MATFFDAQLSAHYHTLKARAKYAKENRAKGARSQFGYTTWMDLVSHVGERGPLLGRILTPERAMEVLDDHYKRYTQDVDKKRLRAPDDSRPLTPHDHAASCHTTAMWSTYNWFCKRGYAEPSEAVETHIVGKKFGEPRYAKAEEDVPKEAKDDPDAVFFSFFKNLLPDKVEGVKKADWDRIRKEATYKTLEAGCDGKNVTRFHAVVTHPARSDETIEKIAREIDPRNWSKNFPQLFSKAYRVDKDAPYRDRFQDPDPKDDETGKSFTGVLFEDASIDLAAVRVLRGRTLLNVDFSVSEKDGEVGCKYSLQEALSNHVLCLVSPSGPDVDSGPEGVYKVKLTGKKPNQKVISRAGKDVRFSSKCHFSDEQNAISLPLWSLSIIAGLVRSVLL
jgi:hypothetical protein